VKNTYIILSTFLFFGCSEAPKPVANKPVPPPPPIEQSAEYWLSHPSIVLLSGEYGVGVDTIMSIAYAFNGMYGQSRTPGYMENNDHTVSIRPNYRGGKGEGPTPQESRAFFTEQAKEYGLTRKDIAAIISAVYSRGNRFTPKDSY
jgi:hypothetical protein